MSQLSLSVAHSGCILTDFATLSSSLMTVVLHARHLSHDITRIYPFYFNIACNTDTSSVQTPTELTQTGLKSSIFLPQKAFAVLGVSIFGAGGSVSGNVQHCEPNSGCKNLIQKYLQCGINTIKICKESYTK